MLSSTHASGDVIRLYRDRIIGALGVVAVVACLPFVINNFIEGRIILGCITAVMVAIIAVDAAAVRLGKDLPIPFPLVFIPIALGLPLSIMTRGLIGVLWGYPAVLLFFFVMPRRLANVLALAVVASVTPLVVRYGGGLKASVRFGVTLLMVIAFSNIFLSIIGELHQRLTEQAIRDPLTGAYNRRHMDDVISDLVQSAEHASLTVVDIDHFKRINDDFGHAAGDLVIRDVATRTQEHYEDCGVFRIGGEEFAIVVNGKSENDAVVLAEQLRETIASIWRDPIGQVTISMGVAAAKPGDDADAWLKRADAALYQAKRTGRNRVCRASEPAEFTV